MKKYFIADALSLTEIILGLTLAVMAIFKVSADIVIWVFVAGELCDAFDGICARRWPYPPMEQPYWWRRPQVVQAIEHISDILLLSMLAIYLVFQENVIVVYLTAALGTAIAAICILTEIRLRLPRSSQLPEGKVRLRIIRRRRYLYLVGITVGVAELIFCTSWPVQLKFVLCIVGVAIGIALIILKWDRFTETHETFLQFLRRHWAKRHGHL